MSAMISRASLSPLQDEATRLFALQSAAVARHGAPSYAERASGLDALLGVVKKYRRQLAGAISADFGNRSLSETDLGEFMPVVTAIKHARSHLRRWMTPQRRSVGAAFRPASARIVYQPLGVVGVVAPWNYPLTLTIVPTVEALAAGNRVMIKPSELTPRTAELLTSMLREVFPEERVAVVTGDADVAARFSALPFDHLFFTGSTRVGRQVMAAAAPNLTPVTLELGGKCPVVVCRDYPLGKAARSVAIGKLFNAGQSCVAPDYVLVHEDQVEKFASDWLDASERMYPTISGNADYTAIVSDAHFERVQRMIDDAVAHGAKIVQRAAPGRLGERKVPPTIVLHAPPDALVLREEIFAPVMPIVAYRELSEALAFINARPKPLALYCFSHDRRSVDIVLNGTRSGGVTVNGTLMHATQEDLAFGGVGESGMGAYHGHAGFLRLSHARGEMTMSRLNMSHLVGAPYGKLTAWVTRLFVGA